MRVDLPPEVLTLQAEVRAWLDQNLPADWGSGGQGPAAFVRVPPGELGKKMARAGLVAPHWPEPFGRDAKPIEQLAIDEVLAERKVPRPFNPIGIGWAGPTIAIHGTDEQKETFLWPLLSGEEIWCQLFSEPEAGSDLASLRTKAERDGDEWVVTGQKIWTSLATAARWGILLARTNPGAPKREGITYFICDMKAPGIDIRPLRQMTGTAEFCEVFLDGVRIPDERRVGLVDGGWPLAKTTLANERVGLSSGTGLLWGMGNKSEDGIEFLEARAGDELERQVLAAMYTESKILRFLRDAQTAKAVAGLQPGPESSVRKKLADEHGQRMHQAVMDAIGMRSLLGPFATDMEENLWRFGFLFSPALTIGGGTAEIQRDILGERVLGLPKEPGSGEDATPFASGG